ncbi:MAG: 30S ribosomal protein S12 methylthiotransferase RimO [Eubacteriales bacterium]|nr:30S ribosomal protein S12 methylthiotransferase RimO [Eubacteriales bacterium]
MRVLFVSLGCDKNLVDTEVMLGSLSGGTYTFTDDEDEAEIAVVNTCCFIHDAKQESVNAILELAERRAAGQLKALVVTGCLAQRYQDEILTEIPEVDAVLGTTATEELVHTLEDILGDRKERERLLIEDLSKRPSGNQKRLRTAGTATGYLKIAEGCDKRCTYCVIPDIRGPYRSIPMEDLVAEAQTLAQEGVRELILVAQETTVYGTDLYGEKKLPELLRRLTPIEGIEWIRLLYCYPEEITDEMIETVAAEPKILPYFDMPIQHASDEVLRRMGRRTNRAELEEIIGRLREALPDVCLRTTLITGFPGEREKDHEILKRFVKKMKFDRLGVFTYSREEGTPAAKMKPQIPARVKKARQKELMLLQQEIAFRKAAKMKGRRLEALIEGRIVDEALPLTVAAGSAGEKGARYVYAARTYRDAPDVDGLLFVESERELLSGDLITVKITGSREYDLLGRETV